MLHLLNSTCANPYLPCSDHAKKTPILVLYQTHAAHLQRRPLASPFCRQQPKLGRYVFYVQTNGYDRSEASSRPIAMHHTDGAPRAPREGRPRTRRRWRRTAARPRRPPRPARPRARRAAATRSRASPARPARPQPRRRSVSCRDFESARPFQAARQRRPLRMERPRSRPAAVQPPMRRQRVLPGAAPASPPYAV